MLRPLSFCSTSECGQAANRVRLVVFGLRENNSGCDRHGRCRKTHVRVPSATGAWRGRSAALALLRPSQAQRVRLALHRVNDERDVLVEVHAQPFRPLDDVLAVDPAGERLVLHLFAH